MIDYYRLKRSHVSLEESDGEGTAFAVENTLARDLDNALRIEKVKELLRQLTTDQQDVILMRFVDELSYSEIAMAMEKSEGAVRLIQHRAIQELKKYIPSLDPDTLV